MNTSTNDKKSTETSSENFVTIETVAYLQKLVYSSSLNYDEQDQILNGLHDLTEEQGEQLKEYLYQNQTCPIKSGRTYNQSDIIRKLKTLKHG